MCISQVNTYNQKNYRKSALTVQSKQPHNVPSLTSGAVVAPSLSPRETNGSRLGWSDKIAKESPPLMTDDVNETKTIGNAANELAAKFMSIIAEERLAGLQRGCHVNKKEFGLDIDAMFKLHPSKRPRFYFSDKYQVNLIFDNIELKKNCSSDVFAFIGNV